MTPEYRNYVINMAKMGGKKASRGREKIDQDVAAFIAGGGQVTKIEPINENDGTNKYRRPKHYG